MDESRALTRIIIVVTLVIAVIIREWMAMREAGNSSNMNDDIAMGSEAVPGKKPD